MKKLCLCLDQNLLTISKRLHSFMSIPILLDFTQTLSLEKKKLNNTYAPVVFPLSLTSTKNLPRTYICPKGGLLAIAFPSRRKVVSSTQQPVKMIRESSRQANETRSSSSLDFLT